MWIGCNDNGCSTSEFYCTDSSTQLTFGTTRTDAGGAMRSVIGTFWPTSYSACCSSSLTSNCVTNSPDDSYSALALCNELGWSNGSVEAISLNYCPEIHWTGSDWSSDWVHSDGFGRNYTCSNPIYPDPTRSTTPSHSPTLYPSDASTLNPTTSPTPAPTPVPTSYPPSLTPTLIPTLAPTQLPTVYPSGASTSNPTTIPTPAPTLVPTSYPPSPTPTLIPTRAPTHLPTLYLSVPPTCAPISQYPTRVPSADCIKTEQSWSEEIAIQLCSADKMGSTNKG